MKYLAVLADFGYEERRIASYKLPISIKNLCKITEKLGTLDFEFACFVFTNSLKELMHAEFPEISEEVGKVFESSIDFHSYRKDILNPFTYTYSAKLHSWYIDKTLGLGVVFKTKYSIAYQAGIFPTGIVFDVVDDYGYGSLLDQYFIKKQDLPDLKFSSAAEFVQIFESIVERLDLCTSSPEKDRLTYFDSLAEKEISSDITIAKLFSLVQPGYKLVTSVGPPEEKAWVVAFQGHPSIDVSNCFCFQLTGDQVEICTGKVVTSKFFMEVYTKEVWYSSCLCQDIVRTLTYSRDGRCSSRYDLYDDIRRFTIEDFVVNICLL